MRSYRRRIGLAVAIGSLATSPAAGGAGPPAIALPDWFEGHRVQAHSESSLEITLDVTPEAHARAIRSLGACVLTRTFRVAGEGAWWPTSVGRTHPLIGPDDLAARIVRACRDQNLHVIAYHRHMGDEGSQDEHPDWICRRPDGQLVLEARPRQGKRSLCVLCMNSPFRQFMQTRLLELADRGVDCLYFDSWHMPDRCACDACRKAFRNETGHDLDLSAPAGSPACMEAVAFVNRTMVRTFEAWREAVRARHPHAIFAIGSSQYPMFFSPHIDENLLAISDTSKTEFHKPFGGEPGRPMAREPDFAPPAYDDQLALGWSLVRDASGGRPPLMWIPYLASEKTALYSAAAAVTYGCIASVQAPVRDLERDMAANRETFPAVFALGDKLSPHLARTRPLPWAALHVSERARDNRLGDLRHMWREVFSPALGAARALREAHVPWVVLTDDALARGPAEETRVLVLPWPQELTPDQKAAVARFERSGRRVIRLNPQAGWHTQNRQAELVRSVTAAIEPLLPSCPARAEGPASMHAMCFRHPTEKNCTVCLTNTWQWFRSTREPDPTLEPRPEPPPCRDAAVVFSKALGPPQRVSEILAGTPLPCRETPQGFEAPVPPFAVTACVVAEY